MYDTDGGWWRPVAFIDWDLAGPDRRRATSDAAGADRHVIDRSELVPTIVWWQQRCADGIERGADAGDPAMKALRQHGALEEVRAAHAWVSLNRRRLDATVLRDQS